MKKVAAFLIGIAVMVSLLVFIQGRYQQETPQTADSEFRKVINLRFGHNLPTDSALHQAVLRYADYVGKRSEGKMKISVHPNQELGNDHQMVEMARQGELDILLTPTAKMSVPVPAMQYADLPFLFPSREDAYTMLDGEPGRMLLDKLSDIGLVGVTFWENGFKQFTANRPLTKPEDFAGLKIRVMKSRIIMDQFRSLGAEPVPIDFHTTRQALADGAVDGQENPLISIVSMGFYEVQSDLMISEHAYLAYTFSISEQSFNRLPSQFRSILIETAREITPWEREETQRREQALLEKIAQAGVRIHHLTKNQRQTFKNRTAHIAKTYEDVIGVDVISKTEEILLDKYGPDPRAQEQVVIGINADLSLDGGVAGLAIKRGVELAVDEINARGGVLGKPLRIIARDHKVTPSMGISNLNVFSARDDLVAVIGGKHSAVVAGEVATVQENRIPYLIPWAAAAQITENGFEDNYLFRVSANDRIVSRFITDDLVKRHRHPALVVENSIWGRDNLERMKARLVEKGISPAAEIVINRGQEDFTKALSILRSAKADSIMLVLNAMEGSRFVKELSGVGEILPVVSHWGIVGGSFFEDNRDNLQRMDFKFFQSFSFLRSDNPVRKQLARLYLDKYGLESEQAIVAPAAVAQAYDLTHLLAMAIEQTGSLDRTGIKNALENLQHCQGAVRHYAPAFAPDRHDALDETDFFMAKFSAEGHIVPIDN